MAAHQHVVKQEDGWAVRGEGNSRYTARAMKTQENSSLMSLQEKAFAAKKSGQGCWAQIKPPSPETPFLLSRLALMFKTVTPSRPDLLQ